MVGLYPSPTTDCIIDNGTKSADIFETHLLHMHTLVIVVVVVLVMILLAIGGNVLVLLSYANDHRLHTISNLYLVHLAVCDIIIGASSMSFSLHFTVHKWEWTLGQVACKVWFCIVKNFRHPKTSMASAQRFISFLGSYFWIYTHITLTPLNIAFEITLFIMR